jgi:hypothetical protein
MEMMLPESVANLLGAYLMTKTLRLPMNTEAIPMPSKILPTTAVKKPPADAKTKAPAAPTSEKKVMTRRGPSRSRSTPIGIWNRAKV